MGKYLITRSEEYGILRILTTDTELFLSAYDVARSLGYKRPGDAVRAHCHDGMKFVVPTQSGSSEELLFITEEDAYSFIEHCCLPAAQGYEQFLRGELPAFRKHFTHNLYKETARKAQCDDRGSEADTTADGKSIDVNKLSEKLAAAKISVLLIMSLIDILENEFGIHFPSGEASGCDLQPVPGIPDALLPVIDALAGAMSSKNL